MSQPDSTYRLKFTGTCGRAEFEARCAEHDFWYHSYYFDNGFERRGDYDIGRDVAGYGFPEDMAGMSVLDVGTGSGWFATYFEQRGADVTTVDVRGWSDYDVFGRPGYPDLRAEKPAPDRVLPDGRPVYYSPVSRGFWIMKDLLGLRAEYVNARIYDLRPGLFGGRKFDLVFLGAVLMHLRDPVGALMAARSVCRHRLIANSLRLQEDEELPLPLMALVNRGSGADWWAPNKACVLQWFQGAGFGKVNADRTVKETVDQPYTDPVGNVTAADQTLYLIDAYVPVAWELAPLPTEPVRAHARMLAGLAAGADDPPFRSDPDPERPSAVSNATMTALVIPEKGLTADGLAAARGVTPVGQLWLLKLTPAVEGRPAPAERVRSFTVVSNPLSLYHLGLRPRGAGAVELVVYARGRAPLPARKVEARQALPVEMTCARGEGEQALLTLSVLGKHQADLPVLAEECAYPLHGT